MGFGLPSHPGWNDLVINEILFDPLPGEPEYIEFYNRSGKVIDPSRLFIVSVNGQTGDTGRLEWVSRVQRCIMPGDYYAITEERESVLDRYHSSDPYQIMEVTSLPSLPDDGATLLLYTREHDLIDRVDYSDDLHFDLLSGTEGISIERISPFSPSSDPGNWHSASGSSGWGTPGIENSSSASLPENGSMIYLSSKKISPDNDGYEDILTISVNVDERDAVISCIIFNEMGFPVNELASNLPAGVQNHFYWSGTYRDGSLAHRGIYIVYVRVASGNGKVDIFKRVCALVR
ncbi:MAG: lamin tail domain-containing protein [Bacteroidales bacterium]